MKTKKVQADGRQGIKFADQLNIYYDEVIFFVTPSPFCFLVLERQKVN